MNLEINKLYTGYIRSKPLMRNFSYSFNEGVYAILGESGCGKTTFLRTVAGLMKPLAGDIILNSKKVQSAYKNKIYMMHQNYTSFDWLDCINNVLISKKVVSRVGGDDINAAREILCRVGLSGYENVFPKQLSGGQRQRLALARTIFTNPDVILMDEPLSALDEVTRKEMQELILEIQRENQNIIIMVTHSKDEAEHMSNNIINF